MQTRTVRSRFARRGAAAPRRGLLMIAAAGASVALALSTAPQAAAAGLDGCAAGGCEVGYGRWVADGDKMWVCDNAADGYSIVVEAYVDNVAQSRKWHTRGAGSCTERSYGDVPERVLIAWRACRGDYSEDTIKSGSCGVWVQAWT
jgi:hypothetical protein